MAKSVSTLKNKVVTIRMTHALHANLKRLAGNNRAVADVIRQAVREYVDDQVEIAGSRRYFTRHFRDEVHVLRRYLSWYLSLITILLAEFFSVLILNLIELDEDSAQIFTVSNILKIAEERLVESGWKVRRRVATAIDDAELEEQRYSDRST